MTMPDGAARMQATILPGGRLHLHDGPIDLIIRADGTRDNVRRAYAAAARRFASVLDELCTELPFLRKAMTVDATTPVSLVARRMDAAVRPLCDARFLTRMAAVAGAVADEVLGAMCAEATLTKAFVNNGGDIALHLSPGAVSNIGMAGGLSDSRGTTAPQGPRNEIDRKRFGTPNGTLRITHADAVRGVATSGFGGRSFSLGIADAVTVLAVDAAAADVSATLVANAVDLPDHPAVARAPARDFDPQSDLGERLVTRSVGHLTSNEIATALEGGVAEAERLILEGHIVAVALSLRGMTRVVGALAPEFQSERMLAHVV